MTDYNIDGIYLFQGRKNKYSGELSINEDGQISGEIRDSASQCPRHDIQGKIIQLEDEVVLEFTKIPTGDFAGYLSPIEYQMRKPKMNGDLSGTYEGAWRFPNPESLGRIGIGYDSEIGEAAIWIPQEEIENKSQLTLTERL